MLGHVADDVQRVRDIRFLQASLFKKFDVLVKKIIRITPSRDGSAPERAVPAMNEAVADDECNFEARQKTYWVVEKISDLN